MEELSSGKCITAKHALLEMELVQQLVICESCNAIHREIKLLQAIK